MLAKSKNILLLFFLYSSSSILTFWNINFDYIRNSSSENQMFYFIFASLIFFSILIFSCRFTLQRFNFFKRCDFYVLIAPFCMLFFNYKNFKFILNSLHIFKNFHILALWFGFVSLISWVFLILSKRNNLHPFLWIVGVLIFLFPAFNIAIKYVNHLKKTEIISKQYENAQKLAKTPNIYFIILDTYARADQLKKIFDYDNYDFLEKLKKRGFYVAEKSYSNYPITYLSIASTLDMQYLLEETSSLEQRIGYEKRLRGDNETVKTLKQNGYYYVHVENTFYNGSSCDYKNEDFCAKINMLSILDHELWSLTPFEHAAALKKTIYNRNELPEIGKIVTHAYPAPFFVFAHTLATHFPHNRKADCSLQDKIQDNFTQGGDETEKKPYLEHLQCANKQIIALVDEILANDPTGLIILQGDHGTSFNRQFQTHVDKWTLDQQRERFATLNAMKIPQECREHLNEDISLVNTFRIVFACLRGEKPDLLRNKSFISTYDGQISYGKVVKTHAF